MQNDLTFIYRGANLSGASAGVAFLDIVRDAALSGVYLKSFAAISGTAVFEVLKNGAVIAGLSAVTIPNGQKSSSVSGLNVALAQGDEIKLNLVSGNVAAPLTFNLIVENAEEITGPVPVEWAGKINVTETAASSIEKNAGGTDWNAGAYSVQEFDGSEEKVRLTAIFPNVSHNIIFGFSQKTDGQADASYQSLKFAVYPFGGTLYRANLGSNAAIGSCANGDELGTELDFIAGTVDYLVNGVSVFQQTGVVFSFPLIVDCSIQSPTGKIGAPQILLGTPAPPETAENYANGADAPPDEPSAVDDEFDAAELDGKWTLTTGGSFSAEINGRLKSWLALQLNNGSANYNLKQDFAPGASDFSITVALIGDNSESYHGIGLKVFNADDSLFWESNLLFNGNARVESRTKVSGSGITHASTGVDTKALSRLYIHIQRVGNTYQTWFSPNGIGWFLVYSADYTMTVAFTQLHAFAGGAASKMRCGFDWIRRDWLFL